MRVLHLGKYWRKDGGIETHVKTLCKSLASVGVDVVNLVSSIDGRGDQFQTDGYNVVESPTHGVYFSTSLAPRMVLDARRLQDRQAFDLIHLHFPDPMSHLVSMALPAQIPRTITWHSDVVKQRHLLKLYRPFQRREIMRAKAMVAFTSSHFTSSTQIPSHYPAAQKHVIPYGMDLGWLEPTPSTAARAKAIRALAGGKFMVFALGRHVEYKGYGVLLMAMQHTSAHLVLGGDGPLTPALKELSQRLGIVDRVCFAGRLSEADLAAHYHACDVFCLPSVTPNEAFGIVQVEAMACGKPVICTQLHNGVNLVNPHGVTGLTVQAGDALSLCNAIENLRTDNELLNRLGQQAFRHAGDTYSQQATSGRYLELYQYLLSTLP